MKITFRILHALAHFCGVVSTMTLFASLYGAVHFHQAGYDNIAWLCLQLAIVSLATTSVSLVACLSLLAQARGKRTIHPAPFRHVGDPL